MATRKANMILQQEVMEKKGKLSSFVETMKRNFAFPILLCVYKVKALCIKEANEFKQVPTQV